MNILKLYYDARTANSEFKSFSEYHKYMGQVNLKRETFTYDGYDTTVYFGFAKNREDCFGKYSGMKFQMIEFDTWIPQEVKDYMLSRLRGVQASYYIDDSNGRDKTVKTTAIQCEDGRILITGWEELN